MSRGRPRQFDSSAILAAARAVFLERGVHATTEEVAERAGVSEGLLYHRFENKERLFREAMKLPEGARPECLERLEAETDVDVRAVLRRTAFALIEWGMTEMPIMMMSWSSQGAQSLPRRLQAAKDPPLRDHRALIGYLERMREAGALADHVDPHAMAFAFLGGLRGYVFLRVIYGDRASVQTPAQLVDAMVRLLVPADPECMSVKRHRRRPDGAR